MGLVLILTHGEDGSADMVVQHLVRKGVDFVRFNTEEFPQKVSLYLSLEGNRVGGHLRFPGREVGLEEISAVWNRRPHRPDIDSKVEDEIVRKWAEDEAHWTLQCLWTVLLGRFWVNPVLQQDRLQFNKLLQLTVATEQGFLIPKTSVTNLSNKVLEFQEKLGTDVAVKSIRSGVLQYPDRTLVLHTVRLSRSVLEENSQSIIYSPLFLQEYVEKKTELRVTVVGEKVFACEIDSQVAEVTRDDWRKHIFLKEELPHKAVSLPRDIEEKCVNLVKRLGLFFGAIDLILTPDEKYVFLEINPNGQWGWVEQLTGMPISAAIAELLANPPQAQHGRVS